MKNTTIFFCLIFLSFFSFGQFNSDIVNQEGKLNANEFMLSQLQNSNLVEFVTAPIEMTLPKVGADLWVSTQVSSPNQKILNNVFEVYYVVSPDNKSWGNWQQLGVNHDLFHKTDNDVINLELVFVDVSSKFIKFKIITSNVIDKTQFEYLKYRIFNFKDSNIDKGESLKMAGAECSCALPAYEDRSDWNCPDGDDASCDDGEIAYTSVTHLIVHHEAGSNTEPAGGWDDRVKSIWTTHVYDNGWCDIGYNWLIDHDGVIYEGRGGGINVQGAHMCGANGNTMGICVLGNMELISIPEDAKNSLIKLLGWRCCLNDIDPLGESFHDDDSPGSNLKNIAGHKDGCSPGYTACPGSNLYAELPDIRASVDDYMSDCELVVGGVENDDPCGAIELIVNTSCDEETYTIEDASESGITIPTCDDPGNIDVWFKFIVPESGIVSVYTESIDIVGADLGLAFYEQSPDCEDIDDIECIGNGNGYMPFEEDIDLSDYACQELLIRVWEYGVIINEGDFKICLYADDPECNPTTVDLESSVSASPSDVMSGEEVTVTVTVENTGDGDAGSTTVSYYIIEGELDCDDFDPSDYDQEDDASVGSLDAGDEEDIEFTFDAPTVTEETIYTIVAYADSEEDEDEDNEVNNWSCDYITVNAVPPPPLPDLESSVSASPSDVLSGEEVTVTVTVENTGDGDAGSTTVSYYIIEGELDCDDFDPSDYDQEDDASVGSLDAGDEEDIEFTFDAPAVDEETIYTIVAYADSEEDEDEDNEVNNWSCDYITVNAVPPPPLPDLESSVSASPSDVLSGEEVTVTVTVENTGDGDAGSTTVSYYIIEGELDCDDFDPSDYDQEDDASVGSLGAGDEEDIEFTFDAPAVDEETIYTIVAYADSEEDEDEDNEVNNWSCDYITIIVNPLPDLESSLSASPSEVLSGEEVTVTITVENTGDGDAGSTTVSYYIIEGELDCDDFDPSDYDQEDDASVGSLGAGDEEDIEFTFDAPAVDEATIYTIVAYADSEEDEDEDNEVNNWSCDYITIIVTQLPDLESSVSASPSDVMSGEEVTIIVTVENTGDGDAGSTTVSYFIIPYELDCDDFDPSDHIQADDAPVGSLGAGDEEEIEFSFDAPAVDEETIYTIVAYADSEEDEVEGNEVNNWSCDYLTIKPLIIEIETFNTLNIEVYPTLVDKEIFVISPSWQDVNISIINAVGQLVEPIITTENPNKLVLNVSNLASGAYILIFNNGVNVQSNKFVIMH
jgi:hypothetical protein